METDLTGMCYYPWVRAVQVLTKSYLNRSYGPSSQGGGTHLTTQFYFAITKQEKKDLDNCVPIHFHHPEIGDVSISPLAKLDNPSRNNVDIQDTSPIVYIPPPKNPENDLIVDEGSFYEPFSDDGSEEESDD